MLKHPPAGAGRPGDPGTIDMALAAIARGEMVVIIDSPERENEGDLMMAAEHVTPAAINFMATEGRGLICAPMSQEDLDRLGVPPMVARNTDPKRTAFHVSVDHRDMTTTGISASDRANTIRALSNPRSRGLDFTQPGHVFPLAYRRGGVLKRAGHTEAAVDLCRMAGLSGTSVICEIAGVDGEMARLPSLLEFAERHGLVIISIADIIAHRWKSEKLISRVSEAVLPLEQGTFTAIGYRDRVDDQEHVALVMGDVGDRPGVLVRMHSECLTGDVFGSRRCDCGAQLISALDAVAREGCGTVVYLRGHEGRGIGLLEKLSAYALQDRGLDTVEANLALGHPPDRRDYGIGMQILVDLGIREMRLLTNNPAKRAGLEGYGLIVQDRVPLRTTATAENVQYLRTKRDRLGHIFDADLASVS